jgi:C-terminal processing protease CtpA/Prc
MSFKNILNRSTFNVAALSLVCSLLLLANPYPANAQSPTGEILNTKEAKLYRERGLAMLDEMKEILEEHYYDRKYRGIDLKARFEAAKNRIKTSNYNWQIYRVMAQVLLDFNDSHTQLRLPARPDNFEYGFATQMFNNKCLVVSVKKGSDAEKQGLRVGDQLLNIGRFTPTREDLWKIIYLIYKLHAASTIDLRIKDLDGVEKHITVTASTITPQEYKAKQERRRDEKAATPFKCQGINPELIACKLYTFAVPTDQIDKLMKEVGQHRQLILDLRGNRGGFVSTEKHLVSYLFPHSVKMADVITRKKTEVRMSGSKKEKSFKGGLIVLVDSNSASASEMLARIVQLEGRGKVVGDVTSGALMTSISLGLFGRLRVSTFYAITKYGMSVTIGDIIMKDGKRVEGVGVIPDEGLVPTGLALRLKTDPVLARAAAMFGANLTPRQAGEFYFITIKEEDEEEPETEGKE